MSLSQYFTSTKRKRSQSTDGDITVPRSIPKLDEQSGASSSDNVASVTELQPLLDLTSLESLSSISARFDRIADALLYEYVLQVKGPSSVAKGSKKGKPGLKVTEFEILELEFYLYSPNSHEDPFTHGSEEQKKSGCWYFHRAPRRPADNPKQGAVRQATAGGAYRSGSRKGLDLTIGGPAQLTDPSQDLPRGGALLRSIRRVSDGKVISGPSLLVDELLRLSSVAEIAELVEEKWAGNRQAFGPESPFDSASLRLAPRARSNAKKITTYRSPRIGLDLSHPSIPMGAKKEDALKHPRVLFINKPYRYYTYPHLLTANGRGQTLFGCLQSCLSSGKYHLNSKGLGMLSDKLVSLTGLKLQTVKKYLDEYRTGKQEGALDTFIGAKGKGAGSSPATFLRLMGILGRVLSPQ